MLLQREPEGQDATVKVKISFEAEIRRFSCAASFDALAGAARKRFGLASIEGFAFQYIDRDQDTITVGSSEELREAIRELAPGADDTLRLAIVPARTSAAPEPSSAAMEQEIKSLKRKLQAMQIEVPPQASESGPGADGRALPTEQHLQSLLTAAISALELDPESTRAWVASLSPEDLKDTLQKSPLSFVGALLASRDAFATAASDASHTSSDLRRGFSPEDVDAAIAAAASTASAAMELAVEQEPQGSRSDGRQLAADFLSVIAKKVKSHLNAHAHVHPHTSAHPHRMRRHERREARGCAGAASNEDVPPVPEAGLNLGATGDALVAKVAQRLPPAASAEAGAALLPDEVAITDTDGDTMVFKLSADGSRVQEFVNGVLELDDVKYIQVDRETGMVHDQKGRFQVRMNERETKLVALSALLERVGVKFTAPAQTVHINFDLNASEAEQAEARAAAEIKVRQACERTGVDPEACLRKLAAVFAALPCALADPGREASAALSASLNEKSAPMHPCANWGKVLAASANAGTQCPPPPEAFDCGDGEDSNCGADATGTKAGEDADMDRGPTAPLDFKWQEQLETLRAMGLDNPADGVTEWDLVLLLEKHLGSLDRVVDSLIQRKAEMSFDLV